VYSAYSASSFEQFSWFKDFCDSEPPLKVTIASLVRLKCVHNLVNICQCTESHGMSIARNSVLSTEAIERQQRANMANRVAIEWHNRMAIE
jgi:hypothetical protein